MRRFCKYLVFLLWYSIIVLFCACGDSKTVDGKLPPTPSLILHSAPDDFLAVGGNAELSFSTNRAWRIDVEFPDGDKGDWFDVAPVSGEAGERIALSVCVDPNETYTPRCFTLVLRADVLEERIEVAQNKKNVILLGDNKLEIGSEEQLLNIQVQSNVEFSVSVKEGEEWISEVPESRSDTGLKKETRLFRIDANATTTLRTGKIVFSDADSGLSDELSIVQAAWQDPDPERSALNAVYQAAGGNAWIERGNWCSDKPLGEWYGVETDDEGHVVALRLPKNNLAGTISRSISKLAKLRHLDLSSNALEGPLDVFLNDLTEAETIDLSHNRLNGNYLPMLDRLGKLQSLNLSSNRIACVMPSWKCLFENGRTVELILNDNCLYGDIPDVIQDHPQWNRLALQIIRQATIPEEGYAIPRIYAFLISLSPTCGMARRGAFGKCMAVIR